MTKENKNITNTHAHLIIGRAIGLATAHEVLGLLMQASDGDTYYVIEVAVDLEWWDEDEAEIIIQWLNELHLNNIEKKTLFELYSLLQK